MVLDVSNIAMLVISSGAVATDYDEKSAFAYLENIQIDRLSDLEVGMLHANTKVTKILLSWRLQESLKIPFDEILDELSLEDEDGIPFISAEQVEEPDKSVRFLIERRSPPCCFRRLGYIVTLLKEERQYPCPTSEMHGNGSCSWFEVYEAAEEMIIQHKPSLKHAYHLIQLLRKAPYIDMTSARGCEISKQETMFDKKLDEVRRRYPIIDMLADPPHVILESVGGGLPQINNILANINSGTRPIFQPPGPIPVPDTAAPNAAPFASLYRLGSFEEAKAFAAILRSHLRDASNGGGVGPMTRIAVLNSTAGGFRIY